MKIRALFAVIAFLAASLAHAEPVSLTGATVETFFSPGGGAGDAVVSVIDSAKRRVLLAGYSFTSAPIAAALKRAHDRHVDVRVVLDKSNDRARYSGATYLANAGVDVVIDSHYPIMHHKFIVTDDVVGFGSMNFTKAGDQKNAENFNIFRGAPALVREYDAEFKRLYTESERYAVRD